MVKKSQNTARLLNLLREETASTCDILKILPRITTQSTLSQLKPILNHLLQCQLSSVQQACVASISEMPKDFQNEYLVQIATLCATVNAEDCPAIDKYGKIKKIFSEKMRNFR